LKSGRVFRVLALLTGFTINEKLDLDQGDKLLGEPCTSVSKKIKPVPRLPLADTIARAGSMVLQ